MGGESCIEQLVGTGTATQAFAHSHRLEGAVKTNADCRELGSGQGWEEKASL